MTELISARPLDAIKASWPLLALGLALSLLGVLTMHPFGGEDPLGPRQLIWIAFGVVVYIVTATADMQFLRRTSILVIAYLGTLPLLVVLLAFVHPVLGAKSWFNLGPFSFQPADLVKLVLIALLAKYFSRRHMEIGNIGTVILSGVYAGIPILLILLQPDLGTAAILSTVWFGMVLVSGLSKKHLMVVALVAVVLAAGLWFGGLHSYQRTRIIAFLNPAADIHGAGYNAYQAVVATGSGQWFGKGIGYGTQSKLRFLPEYETDFIFAAFAEEWGFAGVVLVLILYGLLLGYLLHIARHAATNFDAFFTIGVLFLFLAHTAIHVGINIGLLPVTGTTIPFMSYGGSHILMEFAALGIVASLAQHARSVPRSAAGNEFLGA